MTIPIIGHPQLDQITVVLGFRLTCPCGYVNAFLGTIGTELACTGPGCTRAFQLRDVTRAAGGAFQLAMAVGHRANQDDPGPQLAES